MMNEDQLRLHQVQLLAKKALLRQEIDEIDKALGQTAAILKFAEGLRPAPEAPADTQ